MNRKELSIVDLPTDQAEEEKHCTCCHRDKPTKQFYQHQTVCKICRVDKQRDHRTVQAREHLSRSELLKRWGRV